MSVNIKEFEDQMVRAEHIIKFKSENKKEIVSNDSLEEVMLLLNEIEGKLITLGLYLRSTNSL